MYKGKEGEMAYRGIDPVKAELGAAKRKIKELRDRLEAERKRADGYKAALMTICSERKRIDEEIPMAKILRRIAHKALEDSE